MGSKRLQNVLYIAGEGGKLYSYNGKLHTIFTDPKVETLMGLDKTDDYLYVAAKSRIFKMGGKTFDNVRRVDFHQITIIEGCLYATCTSINEVWKFDLDLNLLRRYKISPPNPTLPVQYKENYNHLNNIIYHGDKFYICLNWLTNKQYGLSGIAVLNNNFEEVERFELGWESHNFSIINDKQYVLCGSSGFIKKVNHPHISGLMVDGKIVFNHNPDEFFCKDFSVDENNIYIVGGSVKKRGYRNSADGVLFVLDRQYNLKYEKIFGESGGFCGCITTGLDLTKNNLKTKKY